MNWTNQGNLTNYFFTNSKGTFYEGLDVDLPVFKKTVEEIIDSNKGELKLIIETILDEDDWLDYMVEHIEIEFDDDEDVFNGQYMIDNYMEWLEDCPFFGYNEIYPSFHLYEYKINNNYKPDEDADEYYGVSVDNTSLRPNLEELLIELPNDKEIVMERDFWINLVMDYYDKKFYNKVRKNFSDHEKIKFLIKMKPKGEPIMLFNWNWESPNDNSSINISTSLCSI